MRISTDNSPSALAISTFTSAGAPTSTSRASVGRISSALLLGLVIVTATADTVKAQSERGFTVTIDGVEVPIDPGETVNASSKDGNPMVVTLSRNPYAVFSDAMVSFQHPGGLTVATQKLSKNITQHMAASALGTAILVQEYDGIDPTTLIPLMVQELTKDDVKIGGELTDEPAERTLKSGLILKGRRATLKFRKDLKIFEVFAYGQDSRGVLLVTIITDDNQQTDGQLIARFWNTLRIGF
jgi:hypothetical protein